MQIFPLNFYNKEKFSGSMGKMNFRLEKAELVSDNGDPKTILTGTVWRGPYNYNTTQKEYMESKNFEFSEEGMCEATDWFNLKGKEYNGK